MGNYVSCTLLTGRSSCAKVIFPGGEIRQFSSPTKAAELMLETPNFFLINSHSLHIGRRFSALNADEDLEMANVYVMFPMKRLNSLVTAADMAPLFLAATAVAKKISGSRVRILPELRQANEWTDQSQNSPTSSPKLSLEEIEGYTDMRHRLSTSRSKKPLLETIVEEPVGPRRMQHYITTKSLI
ncbi:uncharacterized protein LOC116207772 [Punica granatum]|uniref:Uncharacterized protein n=2 Tax=Punica granatum TaxID=22663 RepID=A0A218VVI0_PUNGR|nr:uncharacterized protein LOC116207772 [Punica granatum]OWM64406.1 hypothetical protein CDL15_Pgr020373 [Punica granatum]PKI56775.1 hypothetical protein CRG98_022836 [Punica granatum]